MIIPSGIMTLPAQLLVPVAVECVECYYRRKLYKCIQGYKLLSFSKNCPKNLEYQKIAAMVLTENIAGMEIF